MSSVTDRDRWNVSTDSFHYRLYRWWESMGGKGPADAEPPRPIDLCHYMRVVMIWVWLRWFFTAKWMPWVWFSVPAFIAINWWLYTIWPDPMLTIFTIYLLVGAAAGIAGTAIVSSNVFGKGGRWESTGDRVEASFSRLGVTLKPLWTKAIQPALKWFFMRTLYWRIYPWMVFVAIVVLVLSLVLPTVALLNVLIFLGILVLAVAILIGLLFVSALLKEHSDDKKMKKELSDEEKVEKEKEPHVSQVRELFRLVWQYIVSRKHRICPFIVPTEGPTATHKEGSDG